VLINLFSPSIVGCPTRSRIDSDLFRMAIDRALDWRNARGKRMDVDRENPRRPQSEIVGVSCFMKSSD
jgi:hypothetical protein